MKFNKINGKYPTFCFQYCGEPIGWLGRFIEFFVGTTHQCGDK